MKHDFVTWITVCHMKGTYDPVFKKIKLSFFLDHYNWGNVISWIFVESQYTIHSLHMFALLYSKKKLLFDLFSKELSWIFALMTLVKCQTIYSKYSLPTGTVIIKSNLNFIIIKKEMFKFTYKPLFQKTKTSPFWN